MGKSNWKSPVSENPDLVKEAAGKDADAGQREVAKGPVASIVKPAAPPVPGASVSSGNARPAKPSDAAAPSQGRQKKVAPSCERHYSQELAVFFLPRVKGCIISPVGNRQWQVKYLSRPVRPRSHTQTYSEAPGGEVAQPSACPLLGLGMGRPHQRVWGGTMPYGFSDILGAAAAS